MNKIIVVEPVQSFPLEIAVQAYLLSIGMSGSMAEDVSLKLANAKFKRPLLPQKRAGLRWLTCAFRTARFILGGPRKLSHRLAKVRGLQQNHRRQLIVQTVVPKKENLADNEQARSAVMSLARMIQGEPEFRTHAFLYDRMIDYWRAAGTMSHVNVMSHRLKAPLVRFSDAPFASNSQIAVNEPSVRLLESPK